MKELFKDKFHLELKPILDQEMRPKWSVLIPTYNCANYLKDTLDSVLCQDPGANEMEIIVIDDHSTLDDPEAVVNEVGKGRIKFIRQRENVGKVRNYETGLLMSKGKIIHQLHGDDMVCKGFYSEMENILDSHPSAKAAFCRSIYIDNKNRWTGITGMIQEHEGIVENMVEKLYVQQKIQTPSIVVKREVYENLGGFDRRLNWSTVEDWEMWIRIANYYEIATSNKVLAKYRTHFNNSSTNSFINGDALRTDQDWASIVNTYVSFDIRAGLTISRKRNQAKFLLMNYKKYSSKLSLREKSKFAKVLLTLDPSIINILRFFK